MKLVSALVGLAALGGVAFSMPAASAMPAPLQASSTSDVQPIVQPVAYVCNGWGHCWHQPSYGVYDGGWGWHRWHRWHHWHHGWGQGFGQGYGYGYGYGWHHRWHGWHHWRHWHQW